MNVNKCWPTLTLNLLQSCFIWLCLSITRLALVSFILRRNGIRCKSYSSRLLRSCCRPIELNVSKVRFKWLTFYNINHMVKLFFCDFYQIWHFCLFDNWWILRRVPTYDFVKPRSLIPIYEFWLFFCIDAKQILSIMALVIIKISQRSSDIP